MSSPASPNGNSPLAHFINTIYGDYEGSLPFDLNGELIEVNDLSEIPDGARALPANADGLFFCIGVMEEAERDDYVTCANKPSMAMYNVEGKMMLLVYALDQPLQDQASTETLLNIFEMDPNEGLPLPGQDGWEVVFPGNEIYTAQQLLDAYSTDEEISDAAEKTSVQPEPVADESKKFNDAAIKTPFNPDGYPGSIWITWGKNRKSYDWFPREIPKVDLLTMLTTHEEGDKDGSSFVFADMVEGQRLKTAVISVTAIGLDIDTGTPTEEIDAALEKLGCLAVRYTTHSHMKTETTFKRDEIIKFAPDAEIDSDLMRRYVTEKKHWHSSIAETVEYDDIVHESEGIMVRISHAPMPKNRIIVPLLHPYVIADEGKTQVEATSKWAKYPAALAALLKLPFDPSCTDPSRIFFPPRHPKDGKFSISIFGGPLFDLKSLQIDNPFDALADAIKAKGNPSKTEEGRALGKWYVQRAHGFQMADAIEHYCPEKIRGPGTVGFNVKCPFNDGHHNPGNVKDTGCWAVNADLGNPFVFSCRHETCSEYTRTDFLAKMIKDGSLPESVLTDETFNCAILDDGGEKVAPEPEPDPGQKAILDGILSDIDLHDPKSKDNAEKAEAFVKRIIDAKPTDAWAADALNKLGDRILGRKAVKKLYADLKPKEAKTSQANKAKTKQEISICERLGCTSLVYHAGIGTQGPLNEVILGTHDGRPYLLEKHENYASPLCSPTVLVAGVVYADRNQECGKRVAFLDGNGDYKETDFPSRLLVENYGRGVVAKLVSGGWYGGKRGEDFIVEVLKHAQASAITVHDTGGWKGDAYLFLSGACVPANAGLELTLDVESPGPDSDGTLEGAMAATEKLFANTQLQPHQFCYIAGLAGFAVAAAKDDTLQYSLEELTGGGKTTGAKFGLSHYGDPRKTNAKKKQGGLLFDARGTVNSQESFFGRVSGGAGCLDNAEHIAGEDGQDMVFMGEAGTGKRRRTKELADRTPTSWEGGVVFYTGEIGLGQRLMQEGVKQQGGLSARVFSVIFGEDNKIKDPAVWEPVRKLLDNYGTTGPAFVKTMLAGKWHDDPERIKGVIEKLTKMLLDPKDFEDSSKRRAARQVAYPLLGALLGKRAGVVPQDVDVFKLCKTMWNKFLVSDLAPDTPAKRAVGILLNWLVANKGAEVKEFKNRDYSGLPAMAYFDAVANVCTDKKDAPVEVGVLVYVIRADIIAEKAGGAMTQRALAEELEAQGILVRKPSTPDSRIWNGFPDIGGERLKYVVLRAKVIDGA